MFTTQSRLWNSSKVMAATASSTWLLCSSANLLLVENSDPSSKIDIANTAVVWPLQTKLCATYLCAAMRQQRRQARG